MSASHRPPAMTIDGSTLTGSGAIVRQAVMRFSPSWKVACGSEPTVAAHPAGERRRSDIPSRLTWLKI